MRRRDVLLAAALPALAALARSARAALPDAVDTRDDAVARWLSGTAPLPDAPTLDWLGYASTEDARWARAAPRIRAMREWSRRELASLVPGDRPVVYPFGGPDALHALALFEAAPRLLLIGLEPAVGVPAGARDERPGYFSELGDAMADLHRLTFFRTRDLASQMNDVGVLPVLVATLVRMGGRVTRIAQPASGRASVDWLSSDDHPHRLEYAQADLSNAALARRPDFVATLAGLAPHVTFVKAASYLLGEPRFSHVRRPSFSSR